MERGWRREGGDHLISVWSENSSPSNVSRLRDLRLNNIVNHLAQERGRREAEGAGGSERGRGGEGKRGKGSNKR